MTTKKKSEEVVQEPVPQFTLRALKADGRFNAYVLDSVLDPEKTYTIAEVNKLISKYQHEK